MASRRNVVALLMLAAALALALGTVASGCGGSSESSGDEAAIETTTETTETETTEETTETEETGTETETATDAGGLGALADKDCRELASVGAKFSEAFGATGSTPDYETTSKYFNELVDKAPDEIKDDLAILAGAWQEIAKALADIDLTSGEAPSPEAIQKLQELSQSFNTPELTKASENLTAWSLEHCGGATP